MLKRYTVSKKKIPLYMRLTYVTKTPKKTPKAPSRRNPIKSPALLMAEENQEETLVLKPRSKPPHFVLIHGISLGSWCWYKIKCLMEVSGFTVTCIDLKSSGIDPSSADSLTSFDQYNQPLTDFLSSLPEQEQVRHTQKKTKKKTNLVNS